MGHHLAWLLGCCYQRDPDKGSQTHQRGGDLLQSLGTTSELCSKGMLVFLTQHAEEVVHHALRNTVMVGQIIMSHQLSAPTQ